MGEIFKWLSGAALVVFGGYFITEGLKERGRAEIRVEIERARADGQRRAAERYIQAEEMLARIRAEKDAEIRARDAELERLRHARAGDAGSGDVVFDERWSDWLRQRGGKPVAGD